MSKKIVGGITVQKCEGSLYVTGLAKDIFGTDPVVGSFYVADVVNYVKRMMSFEPVESLSNMSAFR